MFLLSIALLLAARLIGELVLAELNRREVRKHANKAPDAIAAIVDEATYAKSVAYTQARIRFGMISELFDTLLLASLVFSGVLPWLQSAWFPAQSASWSGALYILVVGILMSLPGMPFEWWEHFRLEERFGFNKSTPKLWLTDKLKGTVLAILIGFPLLWALLSLVRWAGSYWWVWGFALLFSFQLLMMVLYPKLILPLFNKLSPLPEGDLKDRLLGLANRSGFKASTIEVMDGSKRSGHSNAFFTGFGRFRRIVLFDTLMQQLSTEELEAVLAHEIGHYRCGHIPKMLAVSALMQLGAFGSIAWLSESSWFNQAFGFSSGDLAPTFLLFGLLSGLVTFWFTPLSNYFSRRYEYEADSFASQAMGSPAPLIVAING